MCATCGCAPASNDNAPPAGAPTRLLRLEHALLAENFLHAAENRRVLSARGVLALNLTGCPGAGKTTLLERTILRLGPELDVSVVLGDQETERDAARIRATGCRAVQIDSGTGCHLDADMVATGIARLEPAPGSLLFIENTGNLVCPALFDLGEAAKVVVMSVTEGEDKPLEYPHMLRAASLMILSKIDLLPQVGAGFDADRCAARARCVNPRLEVLPLSAKTGDGLGAWIAWLRARLPRVRRSA